MAGEEELQGVEEQRAEAWAAYFGVLALGVDEFEARIQREWRVFEAAVNQAAKKTRRGLARAVAGLPDAIDPWADKVLAARAASDTVLWEFKGRVQSELGIVNSTAKEDPEAVVEIMNRRYRLDRGGPAAIITEAQQEAAEAVKKSAKVVKRALKSESALALDTPELSGLLWNAEEYRGMSAEIDDLLDGLSDALARGDYSSTASFIDNIIRALEQKVHQQSITMVDATAGPMAVEAVEEAAEMFEPVSPTLELSYLTHQRSTYRSTVAAMGRSFDSAWPEEDINWLFYVPRTARAGLAPEGFTVQHYSQLKTAAEWEKVREGLDAKRPGSYIFTTGFHPGSAAYLLPIPPLFLAAAVADQRKERQRFLEKKKEEE